MAIDVIVQYNDRSLSPLTQVHIINVWFDGTNYYVVYSITVGFSSTLYC